MSRTIFTSIPTHRYDICEARAQIEAGRTIYRKRKEIMERVDTDCWPGFILQGTSKFEMIEVTRTEFYA